MQKNDAFKFIGVFGGVYALLIVGLRAQDFHTLGWLLTTFALLTVIATLIIWSDTYRPKVINSLKVDLYRPLYEQLMNFLLGCALRLGQLKRITPTDYPFRRLMRATATYELLDRAVLFAVAYPIFLLLAQWMRGFDAALGEAVVIPAEDRLWVRAVVFGLIANILLSPLYDRWTAASPQRFVRSFAGWLPLIAFAGAVAFAVAFAAAGAFAVAFAGAFAGALAVAFAGALAGAFAFAGVFAAAVAGVFAGAFAVAFAFAGVFAVAIAAARFIIWLRPRYGPIASILLIGAPALVISTMIFGFDWSVLRSNPTKLGVFLFLGVLPIINALFDFISYVITLVCAQMGLLRRGHPVFWAAVDVMCALGLFVLLSLTVALVVAIMNRVTGVEFADLESMVGDIQDLDTYWWLYAMAFSTLLPTAVHFGIAALSIQVWAPSSLRGHIIRLVEQRDDTVNGFLAPLALSTLWAVSFTVPLLILSGLVWLWWDHGLAHYLEQLRVWLIVVETEISGMPLRK